MITILKNKILIIEIDEGGHRKYDKEKDTNRTKIIEKCLDNYYLTIIRFNPDSYKDEKGNKIKSCWKISKTDGLLYIPDDKKDEWEERLKSLKKNVKKWVNNNDENETTNIIYLYF